MVECVRSNPSSRSMHVPRISPLGAACSRSAPTEVIQELLKHQADVNLRTGADGMVPHVVGNWKALGFWKYTCESSCMSSWQDVRIRELNHSSNWSLQVKVRSNYSTWKKRHPFLSLHFTALSLFVAAFSPSRWSGFYAYACFSTLCFSQSQYLWTFRFTAQCDAWVNAGFAALKSQWVSSKVSSLWNFWLMILQATRSREFFSNRTPKERRRQPARWGNVGQIRHIWRRVETWSFMESQLIITMIAMYWNLNICPKW